MRKEFDLPESMDGRHAKLSMGTMVHNDRVYVNGVFVGSTGYEYPPRRYHIPAGVLRSGRNVIAVRLDAPDGDGGFVKDNHIRWSLMQQKSISPVHGNTWWRLIRIK